MWHTSETCLPINNKKLEGLSQVAISQYMIPLCRKVAMGIKEIEALHKRNPILYRKLLKIRNTSYCYHTPPEASPGLVSWGWAHPPCLHSGRCKPGHHAKRAGHWHQATVCLSSAHVSPPPAHPGPPGMAGHSRSPVNPQGHAQAQHIKCSISNHHYYQ